jgi:hypothetical protein
MQNGKCKMQNVFAFPSFLSQSRGRLSALFTTLGNNEAAERPNACSRAEHGSDGIARRHGSGAAHPDRLPYFAFLILHFPFCIAALATRSLPHSLSLPTR